MYTITLINGKGGTGKTTTAAELYFSFRRSGYNTGILIMDPQGGEPVPTTNIEEPDVLICDTPGRLINETADWIDSSDLIVITTRDSEKDFNSFVNIVNLVRQREKPFVVVMNEFDMRTKNSKDFYTGLTSSGFINAEESPFVVLPHFTDIVGAHNRHISLVEYKPLHKGARAVVDMCNVVRKKAGFPEEEKATLFEVIFKSGQKAEGENPQIGTSADGMAAIEDKQAQEAPESTGGKASEEVEGEGIPENDADGPEKENAPENFEEDDEDKDMEDMINGR